MTSVQTFCHRAALYLTFGAVVSVLFSIAVCHILMALALSALLISGDKMRFPPIKLPLALFMLGTTISLALSADPAAGRPQIRKFFVFLILLLVYSTFQKRDHIRNLLITWTGVATFSAALGVVQFMEKWQQARTLGDDFYQFYIGERITGFMSHWMTFGGQMMLVLLVLAAFIFFSLAARPKLVLWLLCAAIISASIVLGYTRSIWLATAVGGLYLIWFWRRWVVLVVPVAVVFVLLLGPPSIRARFTSAVQPHGELDSNQHRVVSWRTGWEIISAHPWFGLGPEHVNLQFEDYVPDDVPRPLPEGWYGHLHNIYLHYAAERGVPTMLALMWLLGKIMFDFLGALRRLAVPEQKFFLHGAVAVMLAILVAGFFELNLGDTEVLTVFLTIVACGYVSAETQTREPAKETGGA